MSVTRSIQRRTWTDSDAVQRFENVIVPLAPIAAPLDYQRLTVTTTAGRSTQ